MYGRLQLQQLPVLLAPLRDCGLLQLVQIEVLLALCFISCRVGLLCVMLVAVWSVKCAGLKQPWCSSGKEA